MKKTLLLSLAALAAVPFINATEEPVETRAHYSTNPDGKVGKYANITIDGDFSDWDNSMIIATGGANDQCNAFKGSHENCVLDCYTLYGAWDDTYLYIAWQMVNTADIWAREGDGPLSDGGRVLDVPLAIALSVDPNTPTLTGKNLNGQGLWGGKESMGYEFGVHVDYLLLMSGKVGLGEPAMFKDADGHGNSNYDPAHCLNFKTNDIVYKMKEGFRPSDLWRMGNSNPTAESIYDPEEYVDLLSSSYTGKKHNTTYDSFYEIKIPLRLLGIDRTWLETYGIGCRMIATRGESAIDCIPFDPSMIDNARGDYGSDPSTSHEKDDIDLITFRHADIGHVRDIESIPSVDPGNNDNPGGNDTPDTPSDGNWEVYFQDNENPGWSNVMVWIWDNGNADKNYTGGNWPGAAMSQTNINGKATWKYTFSTTDNIIQPMVIFNNGNGGTGNQTSDLVLENHGIYDRNGKIGTYSGISTTLADKARFEINGLDVTASSAAVLYNIQGTVVDYSAAGCVKASVPGAYILVVDGNAYKLILK